MCVVSWLVLACNSNRGVVSSALAKGVQEEMPVPLCHLWFCCVCWRE